MTAADLLRKIAALRALAERPGTPAEGETARAMLAKLEAKQPEASGERYGEQWVGFSMGFDGSLFRQAFRDAAKSYGPEFAETVWGAFDGMSWTSERSDGVYGDLFRDNEDWHARQRAEAHERQRRYTEEQRKRAYEATSSTGEFRASAADIFEEMAKTGETMAQVFQRKKEEWLLSQRLEAWARSHKK